MLFKEESYLAVGAAFEVYNTLGHGLLDAVYQETLQIEFAARRIPFQSQPKLEIDYKGRKLNTFYIPDFILFGKIVVEIKSVKSLNDAHQSQIQNCLLITGFKLGILFNFGSYPDLQRERVAMDKILQNRRLN